MFTNDYTIRGKHATYSKILKKDNDKPNEANIFNRHIDVYINGAILGFLYGRMEPVDHESNDRVRIYADAMIRESDKCELIYRIIMLLHEKDIIPEEERIDKAFRYDSDKNKTEELDKNLDIFNSYVRGGIEILYEKITDKATLPEDYIENLYKFLENFNRENYE